MGMQLSPTWKLYWGMALLNPDKNKPTLDLNPAKSSTNSFAINTINGKVLAAH